jgi:hypothetical protein
MGQPTNENKQTTENVTFNDESIGDKGLKEMMPNAEDAEKLSKGVTADADEDNGEVYSRNLMNENDVDGEEDIVQ